MRHKKIILTLLFGFGLVMPVSAKATVVPPEVQTALPSASQHGQGTLSFLWYDAYVASLWTNGVWAADKPYALSIVYGMDFTADELIERSLTEMQRAHNRAAVEAARVDLQKSMIDVKQGDRLTGIFLPPSTTRFYHNGQLINTVDSNAFAEMFFGIWLGTKTSEPALRAALLTEGKK